ncbi:hypothetical protein [Streptomyces sp. NPDC101206]|uniref:hypothetical protein n=1 Tax=Streptomyces sp. NPDC101206 TaxID=3366128 RepID=UPI0037FB1D56
MVRDRSDWKSEVLVARFFVLAVPPVLPAPFGLRARFALDAGAQGFREVGKTS